MTGSDPVLTADIISANASETFENNSPGIFSNISAIAENNSSDILSNNQVIHGDLEKLANLKMKNFKNPCIAYLNINSLRGNKFIQLKEMLNLAKPEILCIDETKLTSDFPTAQFYIEGYHYPPFRRDRVQRPNSTHFGGGKIVYVKEDLICDRLDKYETEHAETICLDLTIQERKWFIIFAYRPESIDRKLFFDEMNKSLSKAVNDYEYLVVAGDLNIEMDKARSTDRHNLLSELCATF